MTADLYPVTVMTTQERLGWLRNRDERVPLTIYETSFSWVCPSCGRGLSGNLSQEPMSGWDAPRWVLSGTPSAPTLRPSLGCPGWREGICDGHWWLTDGQLVRA